MPSMRERIFMNQEEKIIKVHLESREKDDFMCFEFEPEMSVCLTNEECQNELQGIFNVLLSELIIQPIKLEYVKNSTFKKGLYIDVCEEYVKDLNREINGIRKKMPELLHI